MKTILAIIVLVVIAFFIFKNTNKPAPIATQDSVVGCYVATLGQDEYSLNIITQDTTTVSGTLVFDNFERDSSHGAFLGTYKDGVLLGDYTFQSEGMTSSMQVIFKKEGDTFIRGFGALDVTGTRFSDLSAITYDPAQTFMATDEACATIPS